MESKLRIDAKKPQPQINTDLRRYGWGEKRERR
jgi:hypothetical protein